MSFLDRLRFKKKPFKEPEAGSKKVKVVEGVKTEKVSKLEEVGEKKIQPKNVSVPSLAGKSGILVRPYLSEKSTIQSEKAKFIFEVSLSATKKQVAAAVEALYGIKPLKVATIKRLGKMVRYGRTAGRERSWKKAIVTLPEGKKIDIYK